MMMNELVHNLFAPWYLALDATFLDFLSGFTFLEEIRLVANGHAITYATSRISRK